MDVLGLVQSPLMPLLCVVKGIEKEYGKAQKEVHELQASAQKLKVSSSHVHELSSHIIHNSFASL